MYNMSLIPTRYYVAYIISSIIPLDNPCERQDHAFAGQTFFTYIEYIPSFVCPL